MNPALSTSEAARRLGISKSTLIRAVNRGEIQPAFRTPGRHLRFTPEMLDEIRRRLEWPDGPFRTQTRKDEPAPRREVA